jgi:hypothetical protein
LWNRIEHAYLCLLTDGLINDVVVLHDLLLDCIRQVLHTSVFLLQIDVTQATVEENLAGVKLEKQTKLSVVDHRIAAQVEKSIVEIGKGLFEVAEEEVRDALLEVCDGKILI